MIRNFSSKVEQIGPVLMNVADALSDGLLAVNEKGTVVYTNLAFARMLKTRPQDALGRSAYDFVFEEDVDLARAMLAPRKSGQTEVLDFRLRMKNGAALWAHCKSSPILEEGKFAGSVTLVQRLADPREEEETRALVTSIVESSDDAIITKSLDGVIRSWNTGAQKMFGYTAREAIGCPLEIIIPADRRDEEDEILRQLRLGKQIDHYETIRKRKDGTLLDVAVTISPIKDSTGAVIGASKVARDITNQKKSEEARSRLAAIVESSDDAIVSKTLEGIIQTWNQSAERIFGYTAEEAIGNPITIIIPADRLFEEVDILNRLRRGERVDHFETVRQRKDGTFVDISVTISPIRNSKGEVVGASKVARDITDQKRAHERMQEQLEQLVGERTSELEKAKKDLEAFTYSVSHDLRGPLRSIVSSCMILQEDFGPSLPAEATAELEKQSRAARKMATLIDDLLKLSRLGRQELKKTNLDITALATEISHDLAATGCSSSFDIQAGLKAFGDAPTIRLALTNLMENACKFSKNGGRITVGRDGDAFFVKDEGIGFDQQYEEKLFIPFERLVLDRDYPGTGIGLANVKQVMDRHGGKVWARSEGADQGATFYFSLPERG